MDSHRLKTIDIKVDLEDIDERADGFILWPLRRLRNIKSVNITGVPAKYETKIVQDLMSAEPVFNTMKHWNHLIGEAIAQLNVFESMFGKDYCECGECGSCPPPGQIDDIHQQLHLIQSDKPECCLTSQDEERMIARLSNLRTTLNEFSADDLEKLTKAVKAKRAAYTDYEAVTDDGRLAEAAKIWNGKLSKPKDSDDDGGDWDDEEGM